MCGVAGFIDPGQRSGADFGEIARQMADSLRHRGPNDQGIWVDAESGVALGHRRLSILDLSAHGHQPMQSLCGRYIIAFNGEIYNHLALRQELGLSGVAPVWHGHSDTETMLAAVAHWGLAAALQKFVGMFAFALWDRHERSLYLARDRMGEKPLYYGAVNGQFLFGSELKALKVHPGFQGEIDRDALALYLRHSYIPAPYSIYKGIRKLPPGAWLQVKPGLEVGSPNAYWSVQQAAEAGQRSLFAGSDAEAVDELERLLQQAISGQMLADVPLGAFLSGGVDSSAVVALMQAQTTRPVQTFTIGFEEKGYNEAEYAHAVAQHLGTEHTELYVSSQQAMAVIPQLPQIYDEPFSDSSQIPTWLVAKLASEQVTVSLSGDGGDELFGGYNRYAAGQAIWNRIRHIPRPLRQIAADMLAGVSPEQWDSALKPFLPLLPGKLQFGNPGDKLHKLAGAMRSTTLESFYLGLVSHWDDPAAIVLGSKEPTTVLTERNRWPALADAVQHMMALDAMSYLPDDILAKVDRAAMSVSLETRVPFLDHRVFEFAWQLPLPMKIRHGQGKHVLRQMLYRYVPETLIERPKMGFGVPLDSWLRGPLKDWAEALLDESRIRREGFFDPLPIRRKWAEHLSGRKNWAYHLWDVLMFQAWLEQTHG